MNPSLLNAAEPAVDVPHTVPRSAKCRVLRRSAMLAGVLLVLVLAAGAVNRDRDPAELELFTLRPDVFRVQLDAIGRVESLRASRVASDCTRPARILSLVPEGTWVQKGDVVCVLDASELQESLRIREVPLIRSRASLDAAVQDEELLRAANERRLSQAEFASQQAENDFEEYLHGAFPQQRARLEQDLHLLEDQMTLAEEEFERTQQLWAQGYASQRSRDQASFDLLERRESVRKRHGDVSLLTRFTHPGTERRLDFVRNNAQRQILRTEIANSLADTKARLTTLESERRMQIYQRYVDLTKKNIEACVMRAPCDGQVLYANSWQDLSRGRASIEEGRMVYYRQAVFQIPDQRMQKVSVAVHESQISRIHRGMPVHVRLNGYESIEIAGDVFYISDYPRARSRYAPDDLEYWLDIQLLPTDEQQELIRLNMDATVTLTLTERPDALMIPREAVVSAAGMSLVWALEDGELVMRAVEPGEASDSMVCIRNGLHAGDRVATRLTPQQKAALEKRLNLQLAVAAR